MYKEHEIFKEKLGQKNRQKTSLTFNEKHEAHVYLHTRYVFFKG